MTFLNMHMSETNPWEPTSAWEIMDVSMDFFPIPFPSSVLPSPVPKVHK